MPAHAYSPKSQRGRPVIVAGARTPYCKAGGALKKVHAAELGRVAVVEALARAEVAPDEVTELVCGNIAGPADAANIARVVALRAGLPRAVSATTVSRNCASGLQSITDVADGIALGRIRIGLAVGVESMSQIPLLWQPQAAEIFERASRARNPLQALWAFARFRPRHFKPIVALLTGLTDPICGLIMGETAEVLAREHAISRDAQDAYALESHRRAVAAAARHAEEIVPIPAPPRWEHIALDIGPRPDQSMAALAKLRPFFDRTGTVTPGNSCSITDGAACVVMMDEKTAEERGLEPLGVLAGYAYAGLDPRVMGLGPVHATPLALDACGLELDQIDLVELNEAFAAQVLACADAFASDAFARAGLGRAKAVGRLDLARTNVNGGAIALGHPVGSTGTRLALTLLMEMARRGAKRGLATLCVGGGQGGALVFER